MANKFYKVTLNPIELGIIERAMAIEHRNSHADFLRSTALIIAADILNEKEKLGDDYKPMAWKGRLNGN